MDRSEENQEMFHDKARKAVESMNVLIDNQEKISITVSNMTEKLNELISDYNCQKHTYMEYLHFVNTWSSIVPNSFFRALNGALGHLTVDLLPGDRPQFLLRSYPEFESTIYVQCFTR
ncbi:hypothetical protein JTB14_018663 [Gonioctena quinquepunctata]|nr:hypothetical protein JTB14_018663 [Gonioctena quinquepunctata]